MRFLHKFTKTVNLWNDHIVLLYLWSLKKQLIESLELLPSFSGWLYVQIIDKVLAKTLKHAISKVI